MDLNWKHVLFLMLLSFIAVLAFENIVTAEVALRPSEDESFIEKPPAFSVEVCNMKLEIEKYEKLLSSLIKTENDFNSECSNLNESDEETAGRTGLAFCDRELELLRSRF